MSPAIQKPWRALNWPNRISLLRLLLIGPFVILLLNQHQWPPARLAAAGIFAMMAVSDFLDGLLARRLHLRTRLGAILDPLADKTLIICSVFLLSMPSLAPDGKADLAIRNWVVVAVVGKDLWVVIGCLVVYLVTDRLRVHPTVAGKLSTVGQLVMVSYVLLAGEMERLVEGLGAWGVRITGWAVMVLSVLAIISYTRLGLLYTVSEGKPLEDPHGQGRQRAGKD